MSYADTDYATTYFSLKVKHVAWDRATSDERTRALETATSIIDSLAYSGTSAGTDHAFPMVESETPEDILKACCEIAYALLDGADPDLELAAIDVTKETTQLTTVERKNPGNNTRVMCGVPSPLGWRFLLPYLKINDSFSVVRIS